MSLDNNLMPAIKEAMLAKDEVRLRTLRSIKTAFTNAKTEKGATGSLTEDQETKILQKLYNQRKEALGLYEGQNREDLAHKEREEMQILSSFLPKQMSDDELTETLKDIITKVGAKGPSDMGKVMGMASKSLAGKAEGGRISSKVKELLQS
jgi:uncharacterized protein YqeY